MGYLPDTSLTGNHFQHITSPANQETGSRYLISSGHVSGQVGHLNNTICKQTNGDRQKHRSHLLESDVINGMEAFKRFCLQISEYKWHWLIVCVTLRGWYTRLWLTNHNKRLRIESWSSSPWRSIIRSPWAITPAGHVKYEPDVRLMWGALLCRVGEAMKSTLGLVTYSTQSHINVNKQVWQKQHSS